MIRSHCDHSPDLHPPSLLLLPRRIVRLLLSWYDIPDPADPGRILRGYDKAHALRTAKMCAALARHLGHPPDRLRRYQAACLLHDLGRTGLDRRLFGRIWTWARRRGIPTRPAEWRARHPDTPYGREAEAFWRHHRQALRAEGILMDPQARAQVEMRLSYARRLRRRLREIKPALRQAGIPWQGWMEKVCLYYYYPEQMQGQAPWVRELGEVLVACEQLEAYNNRRRGGDYYYRDQEDLGAAFTYLEGLKGQGQLGEKVLDGLRLLTLQGLYTPILAEARGQPIPPQELQTIRGKRRRQPV